MVPRVLYYDHARPGEASNPPFVEGEAGVVWFDERGFAQTDTRVVISANSVQALRGHGELRRLAEIGGGFGQVGDGKDAVLGPEVVEKALQIFYEADRQTYGATHEFLVAPAALDQTIEFRIRIDNREYQRTLSRLQFMTSTAARHGQGIRLRV